MINFQITVAVSEDSRTAVLRYSESSAAHDAVFGFVTFECRFKWRTAANIKSTYHSTTEYIEAEFIQIL